MADPRLIHGKINSSPSGVIPDIILNDLCARFLINLPDEVVNDDIRLFFQIELSHWFYIDFYCARNKTLKQLHIKDFARQVVNYCPTLCRMRNNFEESYSTWKGYKLSVPTYGAILIDQSLEYCLLVKGFDQRSSWGFPKGKINENESPSACAIREVLEETGYDIGAMLDTNHYLERIHNNQIQGLFIITGVPINTGFKAKTRQEIKDFGWFKIINLPEKKSDMMTLPMNPHSFYMVLPFSRLVKEWVVGYRGYHSQSHDKSKSKHEKHLRSRRGIDHHMFSANPMSAIHYNTSNHPVILRSPALEKPAQSSSNLLHLINSASHNLSAGSRTGHDLSTGSRTGHDLTTGLRTGHDLSSTVSRTGHDISTDIWSLLGIRESEQKTSDMTNTSGHIRDTGVTEWGSHGAPALSSAAVEGDLIRDSGLNICSVWKNFSLDLDKVFAAMFPGAPLPDSRKNDLRTVHVPNT